MNKKEVGRNDIWKVSAECQNTSCKYRDEIKTGRHLVIDDYIECPKCGYHSFKVYKSIHDENMIK